MATIATLEVLFKSNYTNVLNGISQIELGMNTLAKATGQTDEAIAVMASGLGKLISVGSAIKSAVIDPLIELGSKAIGIASQMEVARGSFTRMLGSAEAADEFIKDLFEFAAETPFEFMGLQENAKRLMAFGFEAERVIPILTDVGDALSYFGTFSTESINRAVIALGQMRASGTVLKQDLNQLINLNIPVFDILQEKLGLTAQQVARIGEQGIESGKVIEALLTGMHERFGNQMGDMAKTFTGMMSTLGDNMTQLFAIVGKELLPAVKPVVEWLTVNLRTLIEDIKLVTAHLETFMNIAKHIPVVGAVFSAGESTLRNLQEDAAMRRKLLEERTGVAGVFRGSKAAVSDAGYAEMVAETNALVGSMNSAAKSTKSFDDQIVRTTGSTKRLQESWDQLEFISKETADALKTLSAISNEVQGSFKGAKAGVEESTGVFDEMGNELDALTVELEQTHGELDAWTSQLFDGFAGADAGLGELGDETINVAAGMDRLRQVSEAVEGSQDSMLKTVFKIEAEMESAADAAAFLSKSLTISDKAIQNLVPTLEGANAAFDQMQGLIRGANQGGAFDAAGVLGNMFRGQEAAMNTLMFMEAAGFEFKNFDSLLEEMNQTMSMSNATLFDMMNAQRLEAESRIQGAASIAATVELTRQVLHAGMASAAQSVATGAQNIGIALTSVAAGMAPGAGLSPIPGIPSLTSGLAPGAGVGVVGGPVNPFSPMAPGSGVDFFGRPTGPFNPMSAGPGVSRMGGNAYPGDVYLSDERVGRIIRDDQRRYDRLNARGRRG